jgi:hypothetical protein
LNDQPQIFHEELFVLLGEGLQDGPYRGRPALVMPDAFRLWEMLLRAFRYCHACAAMIDRICKEFVLKAVGRGHCPGKDKRAKHPTNQIDSCAPSSRTRLKALLDEPDHPFKTRGEHLSDDFGLPRNISGEGRSCTRKAVRVSCSLR